MLLEELSKSARDEFDLTDPDHQKSLYQLSDSLLGISNLTPEGLLNYNHTNEVPLEFKIASKLFESRYWIERNVTPLKVPCQRVLLLKLLPQSNRNQRRSQKQKDPQVLKTEFQTHKV